MGIGIYTNGAYNILGFIISKRLYGIIIKTQYPSVYKKYQFVELPMYHLPNDIKPQFYKLKAK